MDSFHTLGIIADDSIMINRNHCHRRTDAHCIDFATGPLRLRMLALAFLAGGALVGAANAQQYSPPVLAPSHVMPSHGQTVAHPAGIQSRGLQTYNQPSVCNCDNCTARNGQDCRHTLGIGIDRSTPQCWNNPRSAPFDVYGQGGYAGPARPYYLPEYRLRPGDQLQLTFLLKAYTSKGPYRLVVGDELLIEAEADEAVRRGTLEKGLEIQPDGTITMRYIGQVHAAGKTIEQLRDLLNTSYEEFYDDPAIDVTPVKTGTAAKLVREAISGQGGFDAQQITLVVTPSGEIRLPRLGSIRAHGLTLDELKQEINLRYDHHVGGLEVEPVLIEQAPHFVYVLGEVGTPGRFEISSPTTVLGAIALAEGHVPGANLRQVVIFRRDDNWRLLSTSLDLRGAILGRDSSPRDEIWLQDGDVVVLPSTPIRLFDNFVSQVFTEGIYGIVPFGGISLNFGDDNNN